jgi:hypothetical protein
MISDPIFSGGYQDDESSELFIDTDPFSVIESDLHCSDEERDEVGDEDSILHEGVDDSGDELGNNTETHQALDEGTQVWQYNPLLRAKKTMRDFI